MKKNEIKKFTKDQALKNLDKLKKDLFNFMYSLVESMALSLINFILQYLNAN